MTADESATIAASIATLTERVAQMDKHLNDRLDSVEKKIDDLGRKFDKDHDTLSSHEERLKAVEKFQNESKQHSRATAALITSIVVGFFAVAGVVLAVLDRVYG